MASLIETAINIITRDDGPVQCQSGWWGCNKAPEDSPSRLRHRDVLARQQTTGNAIPGLYYGAAVVTMTDTAADPVNPVAIGAIVVLAFFVGFAILTIIIAKTTEGRRDPEGRDSIAADQQWSSETGKGKLLSKEL